MILVIDNYDSFVYNLSRYVQELGHTAKVVRNDAITVQEIEALTPSHIILSPGPCTPNEAGICLPLIEHFGHRTPILGVCLGHQAIGQAYGGKVCRAVKPMHGKSDTIEHDGKGVFKGLSNPLQVARYHSLVVSEHSFPDCLRITATAKADGSIMGLVHKTHPVVGVQFHPESVLTQFGHAMIERFLSL